LNRNGGIILLGVTDDKHIEGVNPALADQMIKELVNLSNNPQKLIPSFLLEATKVNYEDKILIHIFVPASSQVHRCKNKVFDRSADGDFEIQTDDQIKQLYIRKNAYYSENTVYPYLLQTDFVSGIVDRARRMIKNNRANHPWNELSDEDFFNASGLYRRDIISGKEGFTLAALLLFGKDEVIQGAIPHYKIDALVRKVDLDRYDDRENIRCNLIEAYDRLMAFIVKHLPDKFYLEGDLRISLREKIFREIIANILIHREYMNAYPTTLIIYNDRVETKNANKPHLYGQLLPKSFEPFPKNPHIAQMFTQMGRSEELGTGVRNVYKYSKAYTGSDDIQFLEEDIFITKIPLVPNVPENVPESVPENVPENRLNIIFGLVEKNAKISMMEIAKILNVNHKTIKRDFEQLKSKGLIERIGPDNGGYWKINKKL
ncbi:MAG: putative DNA binding domain-containing protein, partial [Fermentimonas sp.]|nr:putative DNA binding domain-containing protein [Fermentimonas sp.]